MICEADMSAGTSYLHCASSCVPLLFIHAQIQIGEIEERRRDLMDARPPDQVTNNLLRLHRSALQQIPEHGGRQGGVRFRQETDSAL